MRCNPIQFVGRFLRLVDAEVRFYDIRGYVPDFIFVSNKSCLRLEVVQHFKTDGCASVVGIADDVTDYVILTQRVDAFPEPLVLAQILRDARWRLCRHVVRGQAPCIQG